MTTPDEPSTQQTAAQRRTAMQSAEERCAAAELAHKEAQMAHNRQAKSNRTKQNVLNGWLRDVRDMPFKEARNRAVAQLRTEVSAGEHVQREKAALLAATDMVAEAARLELTALRDSWARRNLPLGVLGQAELTSTEPFTTSAHGYRATVLRPGWHTRNEWTAQGPEDWSRGRTETVLGQWNRTRDAWVLRDADGNLFMASSRLRLELHPTVSAIPNEGDVLRAAFAAYGWPAFDDGEGGVTSIVVPLDPATPEDATYGPRRIVIDSDERADRAVTEHGAPWSAHLYDEEGNYVDEVFTTPEGADAAHDAAACAAGVVAWIEQRQEQTVGQALRQALAALGISSRIDTRTDGDSLIVPLDDGRLGGPRLIVYGFSNAQGGSVDMPVGSQRAMAVLLNDGERDTQRVLYSSDDPDLAPCLRFIVRRIVAGDLEDKARQAAAIVAAYEAERTRLLADMGLGPEQRPSDCSDLADLRRSYAEEGFALLEDLRDINRAI
ncbi:hypothetical protein ACFYZ9_33615 [Streptomyces sp. NPDC001691]|uniref:hypothetical protein n=1 Tax=Streptomyces sp. NPDC001691 TaxID=3364600 RepID=UPI0036B0A5FE